MYIQICLMWWFVLVMMLTSLCHVYFLRSVVGLMIHNPATCAQDPGIYISYLHCYLQPYGCNGKIFVSSNLSIYCCLCLRAANSSSSKLHSIGTLFYIVDLWTACWIVLLLVLTVQAQLVLILSVTKLNLHVV